MRRDAMIWIGTSGYNYPEWKGSFYPSDLPAAKMLPYYAARFPTVEINYTFYRMPNEKLVGGWAAQTPSPYQLTLKAPRRITHDSRLRNCGPLVASFCQVAGTLGDKLGALIARGSASCCDVFVYVKHEESGKGPEFAKLLIESLG